MNSKISSDWLPSYIKATRPVLEIFKMVEYFLDSHPNLMANRDEINWYHGISDGISEV